MPLKKSHPRRVMSFIMQRGVNRKRLTSLGPSLTSRRVRSAELTAGPVMCRQSAGSGPRSFHEPAVTLSAETSYT